MSNQLEPRGLFNLITAEQLAAELGAKVEWVQKYTRRGVIPAIKIGRKSFYDPEAVAVALRQVA